MRKFAIAAACIPFVLVAIVLAGVLVGPDNGLLAPAGQPLPLATTSTKRKPDSAAKAPTR